MDNIQEQVSLIKSKVSDCTASRQRLKSVLSDFIPAEKQKINLLLNAYDEDIENRLSSSSDKTLTALQFIKILKDDYGLTDNNAFWAVETWCRILGYGEVADAISNVKPNETASTSQTVVQGFDKNECTVGMGTYKAGVDIPSGELKLQVSKNDEYRVYYGISSKPNDIGLKSRFFDQTYITIKNGQYLLLHCVESKAKIKITQV